MIQTYAVEGTGMTAAEAINTVIGIAEEEIGYLEKKSNRQLDSKTANAGSGNYTKYWRDIAPSYQAQPWCAGFITWCFHKAFGLAMAKKLLKHWPYVYCPDLGNKFARYANPKKGEHRYFLPQRYICTYRYCHQGIWRPILDHRGQHKRSIRNCCQRWRRVRKILLQQSAPGNKILPPGLQYCNQYQPG